MVVIGKKKYQSGEGAQFLSRRSALKKLQLSLKDFRKLCILKGIYPREPRNRKRAQQGDTSIKTLYHKKDIQFLMHEPIIWKFREFKIFNRKVGRAKAMRDFGAMRRYLNNHPQLKLDHIVKERYPTFVDALRDLDDCLTLCFLFSTFPSIAHVPREHSMLCRRLTVEFMHAIIAAKALRKVFVSIKGFYYQAEISGQTVTWIVPHHFSFEPQSKNDVDFKIMSTFVEFYIVMLGFVNFRLYHSFNMFYPPKFNSSGINDSKLVDEEVYVSERIAALNLPLSNVSSSTAETPEEEELDVDQFPSETDASQIEQARIEANKVKKLKTLFKGLKFFINREVPREPLVFVLRCFGAEVSWDKVLFVGSTFDENDESITHQIVDRASMDKQYISRYYIQPQWVFDSVNARELLPVEQYLMGAILPPHLSPFTDTMRDQTYIPPEQRALLDPEFKLKTAEDDSEEESEVEEANEVVESNPTAPGETDGVSDDDESEDEPEAVEVEAKVDEAEKERLKKKKGMKVKAGELTKENPWEQNRIEKQEYRLREKMMKKKHRNLYKSMMQGKEDRAKEIWLLRKKRRIHDATEKEKRKRTKKEQKSKQAV